MFSKRRVIMESMAEILEAQEVGEVLIRKVRN